MGGPVSRIPWPQTEPPDLSPLFRAVNEMDRKLDAAITALQKRSRPLGLIESLKQTFIPCRRPRG